MAIKEYLMTTNNFNRPKVVKDQDAIYTLLVKLALLEPGTYQTHPDMGLGLCSKYRYSSDVEAIKSDYKRQIQTYLPMVTQVEILAEIKDHYLILQVQIDDTVYPLYLNTESNSLEDFIN